MSLHSLSKLPDEPEGLELRREVRATLDAYAAFLKNPVFEHSMDIAVLTKIAGDENVPVRERRRAAEVLAKLRLKAMEAVSELSAVRQQVLRELGLEDSSRSQNVTQVNTRIEIIRADDWRAASADILDAEVVTGEGEAADASAHDP